MSMRSILLALVGCFAACIANTWGVPIAINADYNGQTINMASGGHGPLS